MQPLLLLCFCTNTAVWKAPATSWPQELAPALQLLFRSSVSAMLLLSFLYFIFLYTARANILIILNNSVDSSRPPHKPSLDDKSTGNLFPVDVRWMELRRCGASNRVSFCCPRESVLKPKKDRAPNVQLKFSKCGLAGLQKNAVVHRSPIAIPNASKMGIQLRRYEDRCKCVIVITSDVHA